MLRLCCVYAFLAYPGNIFLKIARKTDNSPGYDSILPISVLELIPAALALLTLFLWLVCMKKKIWALAPIEDEIRPKPALSIFEKMLIPLVYILLLSIFVFNFFISENKIFDLVKLPFYLP